MIIGKAVCPRKARKTRKDLKGFRAAKFCPGHVGRAMRAALNTVDLSSTKPSPEGEGWVTTARMQEAEQRREQLPRGNQNKEKCLFLSPHPSLLPGGEGAHSLKSTVLRALVPKAARTARSTTDRINGLTDCCPFVLFVSPRQPLPALLYLLHPCSRRGAYFWFSWTKCRF
jgi:hypothetical protein